jgi:hypothetical protein
MDFLHGIDAETLNLIMQMQLEDLQEIARANVPKGKGRTGEQDARADMMAAIETYSADLTAAAQILADEAMCRSIANAVEADADLIGAALSQEDQLIQDRELAFELSGQRRSAAAGRQSISQKSFMSTTTDEDTLERLRALNISPHSPSPSLVGRFEHTDTDRAESSSWAQTRRHGHGQKNLKLPAKAAVPGRPCVACTEHHPASNLARSPCGHEYCRNCLKSLVTASFTDETLFPPKCCGQTIPIDTCRPFLTAETVGQFNAKKLEFDTPNRTYCHRQACSAFVPPQYVRGDIAYCVRDTCRARTCAVCKAASHVGSDCPENGATQDMLRMAAAEGWQRCYACARFVELETGCNHISGFAAAISLLMKTC